MRIALNTHYTLSYTDLAVITVYNMKVYCAKNGYDLYSEMSGNEEFHFVKTKKARELLNKYDLVMSIEADCLLTNHKIRVESFIDDEHDVYLVKDINGSNSGVVIWKSTEFSKLLLELIESKKGVYGDEQNLFENFESDKIKYLPHPSINSFPYDLYAPSYGKIGYEEDTFVMKPTHEEGDWEIGDFCFHLPGMTLHRRISVMNTFKDLIVL